VAGIVWGPDHWTEYVKPCGHSPLANPSRSEAIAKILTRPHSPSNWALQTPANLSRGVAACLGSFGRQLGNFSGSQAPSLQVRGCQRRRSLRFSRNSLPQPEVSTAYTRSAGVCPLVCQGRNLYEWLPPIAVTCFTVTWPIGIAARRPRGIREGVYLFDRTVKYLVAKMGVWSIFFKKQLL
jgi:hypothetical protein